MQIRSFHPTEGDKPVLVEVGVVVGVDEYFGACVGVVGHQAACRERYGVGRRVCTRERFCAVCTAKETHASILSTLTQPYTTHSI